jgi:hypothetical protein
MRFLIIGTGWYGCHLASILIDMGHQVTIVDKSNSFFGGSSYKNQNRLHLGFHYPRSSETIKECQDGYVKFLQSYPTIPTCFPNNYYFIASVGSKIGIEDYKAQYSGIPYTVLSSESAYLPLSINPSMLNSNVILTNEQYINPVKSKDYFQLRLGPYMKHIDDITHFSSIKTILSQLKCPFDYILNCTYNQLEPILFDHYELFVSFLYKIPSDKLFAYTIMDGDFYSIYPYDIDNQVYTVTSVKYGVLKIMNVLNEELAHTEEIKALIEERRALVETDIGQYIPNFKENTIYSGHFLSWKTKPNTQTDDRSIRYSQYENIISFYGGKITGIFHAESVLRELIPEL